MNKPFTGTQAELAAEFDAHAKDAMDQYNATDWNSKSKRAGMIAKAQTWQKAAGLVRNAANAEIEALQKIAKQKTTDEMSHADGRLGDFEGAYDMCIEDAREALTP